MAAIEADTLAIPLIDKSPLISVSPVISILLLVSSTTNLVPLPLSSKSPNSNVKVLPTASPDVLKYVLAPPPVSG